MSLESHDRIKVAIVRGAGVIADQNPTACAILLSKSLGVQRRRSELEAIVEEVAHDIELNAADIREVVIALESVLVRRILLHIIEGKIGGSDDVLVHCRMLLGDRLENQYGLRSGV